MKDEIIEELWRIKDEQARAVNYDIHALCRELREQSASSDARIVDRSIRRPEPPQQKSTAAFDH